MCAVPGQPCKWLSFRSRLEQYQKQAEELLEGYKSGDAEAIRCFKQRHPRFMDPKIAWLPKNVPDSEVRSAALGLADAQLTIARWHDFQSWPALAEYAEAVSRKGSAICQFESAVEAVINGDVPTLERLLRENPELVRARSTRVTHFDPPRHRAMLLHYVAANGVEGYRQKCPRNAVDVARTLLRAGAEVDALADLYGGQCTTMTLLVSSCHPAEAGVQVALVETLLDGGAAIEGRGARVDNLAAAAGLGRVADAREFLPAADGESRHRALALSAQYGHEDIVRLLLDAGEDPSRYNPEGNHSHSTPLHQAAWLGDVRGANRNRKLPSGTWGNVSSDVSGLDWLGKKPQVQGKRAWPFS